MKHPKTKEEMFFNQVQIHHIYCVDEDTRDGLRALFDEEDLPRNVYYGDGSPIPDETMEHLGQVFEKIARALPVAEGRHGHAATTCSPRTRATRSRGRARSSWRWAR